MQTSISGATDTQQFCYDSLNRMTWAGASGTPPCASLTPGTLTAAQYQQSDSYNIDGGLTSGPHGSSSYGNSSHPHALMTTSNGYSAAYDAAGNLTCRAPNSSTTCSGTQTGQQLSYDPQGRLTSWQNQPTAPTQTANYLSDGEGNRVAMATTVSGTTTTTASIGSIEEVQTTGGSTQTTTYYTVESKRIAAKVNGTFFSFGYDALGSQVVVLNASGNVVGSQLYGPYGNQRYSTGTLPTSIGFAGQRADSVTGLDYYVARYYDPLVGQFLSADTVQGNVQGMDLYTYVAGNPETRTDPTGHRIIGENGNYGNIDPFGNVALFNPFDPHTSGGGYEEGGNHAYHHHFYTKAEMQQPVSQPDPSFNNTWAKIQNSASFIVMMAAILAGDAVIGLLMLAGLLGDTSTNSCGGGLSFASATKVHTDHGGQAIGTLHVGEKVWAYNPTTRQMELQPILHMWVNQDNDLVYLTITSPKSFQHEKVSDLSHPTREVLHTNKRHPFLTLEKGFIPVSQLTVGMHILRADGSVGVVTGWKLVPGVQTMYNLEVQQDHTYTVGDGQWIVHNRNCADGGDIQGTSPTGSLKPVNGKYLQKNMVLIRMKLKRVR
ncbi:MAG TPA: RHS repeat-associated core domain-containing protein [Ktedonobacteraceae bacterium]|nr:RHS repeat-associated core domain-containing protein [Ktedonobacteraceae bacterium]